MSPGDDAAPRQGTEGHDASINRTSIVPATRAPGGPEGDQGSGDNRRLRPYALGHAVYLDTGWPSVLPASGKGSTPKGFTGYGGPEKPSDAEVAEWVRGRGDQNLTLRLPRDIVGLDFDAYKSTEATETCQRLESQWGLPPTWRSSSRFGDDYDGISGIRLYRLPEKYIGRAGDRCWNRGIADCIDVIRFGHRHCVAWPSVHVTSNNEYRWLDEATGEILPEGVVPRYADIPLLPEEFVEQHLRKTQTRRTKRRRGAGAGPQEPSVESDHLTDGSPCPAVQKALDASLSSLHGGTRYDDMVTGQVRLVRLGEQGHQGTRDALEQFAERYVEVLSGERGAASEWDRAMAGVDAEIERAGLTPRDTKHCCDQEDGPASGSLRDRLIGLTDEHFSIGRTTDDRVFIVERDGPNLALFSAPARKQLALRLYESTGRSPGRTPIDEAWAVIEAKAQRVDKTDLPTRVAMHGDAVVIDMGTADGRAIVADRDGWRIASRSPVTFRRSTATKPLPEPSSTPSWDGLWDVVNVQAEDRDIVRAFLVQAAIPAVPHPILQVNGEQGSAKSTASRYLASILDPGDVLAPPRDEGRWSGYLVARWTVAIDNVSRIEPWWSDALCRASTGAATMDRRLYTDDDIHLKQQHAVVILNGIGLSTALRNDLAERLLPIELLRPADYRTMVDVDNVFRRQHPHILAALLDDLVAVMRAMDTIDHDRSLRMADFAKLLAEFDEATGSRASERYQQIHGEAADAALESDKFAQAVMEGMKSKQGKWSGTAAELLGLVEDRHDYHYLSDRPAWWPDNANAASSALMRSSPSLKRAGMTIDRRKSNGKRIIDITWPRDRWT